MTEREKYVLTDVELNNLLVGIEKFGVDKTYMAVKSKAFGAISCVESIDEMLMDQYDSVIEKARSYDQTDIHTISNLYSIASILRRVGHQLYRQLLRSEMRKESDRFLNIIK